MAHNRVPSKAPTVCDTVAQSVEQRPFKPLVVGSIPTRVTNINKDLGELLSPFSLLTVMDRSRRERSAIVRKIAFSLHRFPAVRRLRRVMGLLG